MKLVEIKNSLAKLYYEPADFPLILSDFLTIDDGNQKILSQVVSIESTSKDSTNCAILKFSLDLNADNTHCSYSGYVPPLDALVSKTKPQILSSIFSDKKSGITLGQVTSSTNINLDVKPELLENFLYIQSDIQEETQKFLNKILEFNFSQSRKTLVVDFDGITSYENANVLELGKNFKLPVDNEILNYIYEYDLAGLTVEQKTIVQDIILEIQDYIETLEEGCIPFNTLLSVVNDIYETDKSTGVILLRNKLLKYNQFDIFASNEEEITSIDKSMKNNVLTVLSLKNASSQWQKETLDFVLNYLQTGYYLIFEVNDEAFSKEIANKIYKEKNIKPIIFSKYDSEYSSQIKSFAKNLILFKPLAQQRAFATYNSFLNKMAQGEFIVSGESTYYTPLIVKSIPEKFEQIESCETHKKENDKDITIEVSAQNEVESTETKAGELLIAGEGDDVPMELDEASEFDIEQDFDTLEDLSQTEELEPLETFEEDGNNSDSELKNIFEESLEQEIAKDVDKMFYAEAAILEENSEEIPALNENIEEDIIEPIVQEDEGINYEDMFSDDDLDMLDEINSQDDSIVLNETETLDELPEIKENEQDFSLIEEETVSSIPVYSTEIDEKIKTDDKVQIAEGNIVYHEKYGRGVVEQLITYGKKTLCSIQFDNVGRRLLDPNLADLKQM